MDSEEGVSRLAGGPRPASSGASASAWGRWRPPETPSPPPLLKLALRYWSRKLSAESFQPACLHPGSYSSRATYLSPESECHVVLSSSDPLRTSCLRRLRYTPALPVSGWRANATTTFTDASPTDDLESSFRRQNKALARVIRGGSLRDARQFFDGLCQRNVVTWNTMLGAYVRHREIVQAWELFRRMPNRDVVSWNSMLLAYTLSGQLEEARQLFEDMPVRDAVSWNTMISGYAHAKRMGDALDLFQRMDERNAVSWNAIVTGFLENGDVDRALEAFEGMTVRDSASLSALISGLVRNGRLEDAESALIRSEEKNVDAYNTLIAGFAQRGRVKEAQRLFDMIPCHNYHHFGIVCHNLVENGGCSSRHFEKNVVSWNTMIMCYVKVGDVCSARRLFDEMPRRDIFSWNTMICGYAQFQNMEEATSLFLIMPDRDSRTWNFIISGYSQNGDMERARKYFDQMPCKSIISWNTMIVGYEQNGSYDEAIQLFSELMSERGRPDRHTLSSVLGACAGIAILSQGVQIHQLIIKTVQPDTPLNNALITMYSRCGNLSDARFVFDEMRTQRDVVSWNAMIGGYAQHGFAGESLILFREMTRIKMPPTHVTFVSVLNACCHAGLVAEGQKHFDAMVREYGISPDTEHYACLVNLFGRHGQLDRAMGIIEGMPMPPDKAVWGALLGACRLHKNASMAQVAVESLLEIDPGNSAPYVLLSNMHAGMDSWDDAVEVREMMDRNGIRKQPGHSWIELHGNVHVFLAGGSAHPLSDEILAVVDSCNKIIREVNNESIGCRRVGSRSS